MAMQHVRFAKLSWTAILLAAMPVVAHHSFAVFFDDSRQVKVTGTVQEFQFRNPHGVIKFIVTDPAGAQATWKAETNSPSILERRGWTKDSLKAGDVITVEGWPARDGSRYLRMRVALGEGMTAGNDLSGTVQPGRGLGSELLRDPVVAERFEAIAGFAVVPGTLNIRLPGPLARDARWRYVVAEEVAPDWRAGHPT